MLQRFLFFFLPFFSDFFGEFLVSLVLQMRYQLSCSTSARTLAKLAMPAKMLRKLSSLRYVLPLCSIFCSTLRSGSYIYSGLFFLFLKFLIVVENFTTLLPCLIETRTCSGSTEDFHFIALGNVYPFGQI